MSKKKIRKATKQVKLYEDTHALLKFVSFKNGKDMCDVLDDLLKNTYTEELKELDNMKNNNK